MTLRIFLSARSLAVSRHLVTSAVHWINEDNLRDLWDNVKHPNIQIIGVPEEEKKKKTMRKCLRR